MRKNVDRLTDEQVIAQLRRLSRTLRKSHDLKTL